MGMVNRSAPPGDVVPVLYYDDVEAAIDWLCGAFGFTERYRYGPEDDTVGAFLVVGESSVAAQRQARRAVTRLGRTTPRDDHPGGTSQRAVSRFVSLTLTPTITAPLPSGAKTFGAANDHRFGERQYTAEDLAGHRWSFTQSVADIAPEEWGAKLPS